jgi:hypothetical protein
MPNKINDFLKPGTTKKTKLSPRLRKCLKIIGIVLGGLIAIGLVLFLLLRQPLTNAYHAGINGKNDFLKAEDQLKAQDFEATKTSLASAVSNFQTAHDELGKARWLSVVPWVGTQIKAVDNVISAGIATGQSIQTINDLAITIIEPLQKNDNISLNSLSEEETRQLLKNIYEAKPKLEEAKQTIDQAVAYTDKIPSKGVIKKLNEAIDPLKKGIPQLQQGIDQAISASQIIPSIAGYPDKKTYLFLLQNNAEMRPTGGFIGTYGVLKVKDGDIDSFNTDNVYNLDTPAEAWMNVTPPSPLTRYNAVTKWLFRDSNWSPDFPTAAQKAEWFYQQEKGPEKNIDGDIAITPVFIQSLLGVTGSVTVNGLTFTQDNLVTTLQYQVEQGFLRQGINESDRKEIIGVLSKKILDAVLDLPKSKWPDLWNVFSKDISEKQILMYMHDEYIQNLIIKENWGGAIQDVSHDYVAVVDANLASLKSDPGVKRTYAYSVRRDGDNLIADLSINYDNQGSITWKTTRYRTYTRVYVPQGATLLSSTGMMIDCKVDKEGSVETTEELNKTVFGTFICIEPGESKSLTFKYKLPSTITDQFKQDNAYQLLFRKQPGAADFDLNLQINLDKKVKTATGIDNTEIKPDNTVSINTSLSQDRNLTIGF